MSPMLDELVEIAQNLPDEKLADLVTEARLRAENLPETKVTWPPKWFGSITDERTDVARNVDTYLAQGFGQ